MATAQSQRKWRDKNRFVKRQLNVMARKGIHDQLAEFAAGFGLKGKGESVAFACFVTEALIQRATFDEDARHILEDAAQAYARDRELYEP